MSTAADKIVDILIESDDDFDPKYFVQSRNIQVPRFFGQLKAGQVIYADGIYARISEKPPGMNTYQTDGRVFYDEFNPCYAYGKHTQHVTRAARSTMAGTELKDELFGASDEQLWALVIKELEARRRQQANESLDADDFDPKEYASAVPGGTNLGPLSTETIKSWLPEAGIEFDSFERDVGFNGKPYVELRGCMTGTLSSVRDRLEGFLEKRDIDKIGSRTVLLAVDSAGPGQCISRGINILFPVEIVSESEEFDADSIKRYADQFSIANDPGIEIGFSIRTSDQFDIEENAAERGIVPDWDSITKDSLLIERNAVAALNRAGIVCSVHGHDGDNLVGLAHFKRGTHGWELLRYACEKEEAFSTCTGSIDEIEPDIGIKVYEGTDDRWAGLIDVSIFFATHAVKEEDLE